MRIVVNAPLRINCNALEVPSLKIYTKWLPANASMAASLEAFRYGGCLSISVYKDTRQELPWRSP